jgi:hypothetical protein
MLPHLSGAVNAEVDLRKRHGNKSFILYKWQITHEGMRRGKASMALPATGLRVY